ncbi:hypothetical protein ALC57_09122 [Trachymyrmex cornetzi]|uniref:Uncharacterized protein n=1 Tax=Trachymyrmex cornetzi TaxID=471704 RepID=A0A151J5Q8_9HYME|nr:hypothetical protein ALC57_09122 [Trachymyrmex cornetzi]
MVRSSACPCGDPHQDINYIIFQCPITNPKSVKLTTFIDTTSPNTPRDIFPLLKKPSAKLCRLLLAFSQPSHLKLPRPACVSAGRASLSHTNILFLRYSFVNSCYSLLGAAISFLAQSTPW